MMMAFGVVLLMLGFVPVWLLGGRPGEITTTGRVGALMVVIGATLMLASFAVIAWRVFP